jgi:hypothetical protein
VQEKVLSLKSNFQVTSSKRLPSDSSLG